MVWCGSCLLFQLTLNDISGAHIIVADQILRMHFADEKTSVCNTFHRFV